MKRSVTGLIALSALVLASCAPAAPAAPTAAPTQAPAKPAATTPPAATAAAAAAPTAAPTAVPKPAAAPATTKVRYGVGTNPLTITTAGVYFGIDNGFFRDEGLDVEVSGFVGGGTTMRALLSREIDIASTTADSVFSAHQNGAPVKVIVGNVVKILDEIVAVNSVPSLKDLAGKRWAISAPNSQSHGFARIVLQKNGVDPADVEFVAIGSPADRVKSLLAGRADATTMVTFDQKEVLAAIEKGDIRVLGSIAGTVPELANQYDITRDDLVRDQPETLSRFVRAEMKGMRWMAQNVDKAADIIVAHVPSSAKEDVVRGLKEMVDLEAWGLDGGFTMDSIDKAQAVYQQLGIISKTEKADEVATTRFIDQANKDLGPTR
jgi:NitT/TauT family transport system substrate-binding protein